MTMQSLDLREMSFQNVLDTILKPAGVKVGGFPEELFVDLTEEEKEKFPCLGRWWAEGEPEVPSPQ